MMTRRSKKNVDMLSKLPEDILSHILSLMPTKFAVRTSILSKRWRYAWTFVTNLDFSDDTTCSNDNFQEFVDRVLKHCKTSQISLFRLRLSFNATAHKTSVSDWIDKAVRLNVRELILTSRKMSWYELPSSLFTCNTLTKLTITCSFRESSCPVNLPSLKILEIAGYRIPLGCAVKFISGSPILESLSLEVTSDINAKDCTFNIPTLKRLQLTLQYSQVHDTRVVLNVPNLEHLIIGECHSTSFVMKDVSSLVAASILPDFLATNHVWAELLKGVSGVKSLSFGYIPPSSFLPIFPNLMFLEKKCGWHFEGWHFEEIQIFRFLESCPKLKHLYIEEDVGFGLYNPKSVPTCLLTSITTIKFSSCKGSKCDMKFLGYLLENANALKTVTITWDKSCVKKETKLCAQLLLKSKRASRCCKIQFYDN